MQSVNFFMVCDFKCLKCKFPDCILDFESGSFLELAVLSEKEVDSVLFPKLDSNIEVPDYRLYPFIPSEEIPFNPKWKSQAKWREYYRSTARGNRRFKINATKRKYYQAHKEEFKARRQKNKEEINAKRREYYHANKEKCNLRHRVDYLKHRDARLAYQREYYARKKQERKDGAT